MTVDGVAVCQTSVESVCSASKTCTSPLVCRTADNTCRAPCTSTGGCLLGTQTCVGGTVCVDTTELAGKDASAGAIDGAAGPDVESAGLLDGAAGADAGLPGDAPTPAADAPSQANDVASVVGVDSSPGADAPATGTDGSATGGRDTAGSTGDASVLVPPDLRPTTWDSSTGTGSDATISVTAVATPISARAGEEITLTVSGTGLTGPDHFTLGGVVVGKSQVSGASDVTFTATLTVPHGITPGIVDLGFTCVGGQAVASAVLQVTPIAVSLTGADVNRGTPDNPFRTFTKAVQTGGVGDTIQVGEGEFKTGETWPTLPDKVSVLGAGPTKTTFTCATTSAVSFTFAGDATVKGVAFSNFSAYGAIVVSQPRTTVVLESISYPEIAGSGDGLLYVKSSATSAKVTVAGKDTVLGSSSAYYQTIELDAPYSTLVLRDGTFLGGANGLVYISTSASTASVQVDGATLGAPSNSGDVLYNSSSGQELDIAFANATINGRINLNSSLATLAVSDSSFTLVSGAAGISFSGKTATVTNTSFLGGKNQINASAGQVTVRTSKFSTYESCGINVYVTAQLDLGTATDSGGNEFTGSKASGIYGLYDYRSAVGPTIPVSGTSFNGVIPPAGVVTKSTVLAACEPGAYCIYANGNSITFF